VKSPKIPAFQAILRTKIALATIRIDSRVLGRNRGSAGVISVQYRINSARRLLTLRDPSNRYEAARMNTKEQPDYLRLADVPSLPFLARFCAGRPIHLATIYRWVQRGINGRKLMAVRIGGRGLATTEEWLIEFFTSMGPADKSRAPTSRQRERRIERANRELEAAGI
jgi:hypothetical protein